MYDDPIVAGIRQLRDEYARRFGYDLDAICRDLCEQQRRGGRRVIKRQPRHLAERHTLAAPRMTEPTDEREPE